MVGIGIRGVTAISDGSGRPDEGSAMRKCAPAASGVKRQDAASTLQAGPHRPSLSLWKTPGIVKFVDI
jgi:hypothetical protein